MAYYKGITPKDIPENGGSYVTENGEAHECYNFDAVVNNEGKEQCLGFAMLTGRNGGGVQIKLENIVGCSGLKNEDCVEGVTVVWCAKTRGSNIRVVGFYKNAKVYRNSQFAEFDTGYIQQYNFVADKKDCVLIPYSDRNSKSEWYVPTSGKNNSTFGFGRSSIWYGGSKTEDKKEIEFVEKMLENTEKYDGENWIDVRGDK